MRLFTFVGEVRLDILRRHSRYILFIEQLVGRCDAAIRKQRQQHAAVVPNHAP